MKVYIVIYEESNILGYKFLHLGSKFTRKVFTEPKHPNIEVGIIIKYFSYCNLLCMHVHLCSVQGK